MIVWDTGLDKIPETCEGCSYFRGLNVKDVTGYCKLQNYPGGGVECVKRHCKLTTTNYFLDLRNLNNMANENNVLIDIGTENLSALSIALLPFRVVVTIVDKEPPYYRLKRAYSIYSNGSINGTESIESTILSLISEFKQRVENMKGEN